MVGIPAWGGRRPSIWLLYLDYDHSIKLYVTGAMADQRQLYRVAIDRTGEVRRGDQAYTCHVIDLTEHGVRLQINGAFLTGDRLQLEFALTDIDLLSCTIQVTNRRPPYIGAVILQMAPDQQRLLSRFIEQVNALNMSGF